MDGHEISSRPVKLLKTYKYLFLQSIVFLLILSSQEICGLHEDSVSKTSQSQRINVSQETWNLSSISDVQENILQDIIEALEKLRFLQHIDRRVGCFSLQSVRREDFISETSKQYLEISFTFEELEINSDKPLTSPEEAQESHASFANRNLFSTNCKMKPSMFTPNGLDKLSRKQDDNEPGGLKSGSKKVNVTDTSEKQQVSGEDNDDSDDKQQGLSRTQVVVIATCSAVIGTFFIIAGALRIHSCVKRYRSNREAALNIARPSSSCGLGGSGNLRRDSASSKASRQSRSVSKAGSDYHVDRNGKSPPSMSHNSPLHTSSSDHKPLLASRVGEQLSDGYSSHGSLAFIDEETQSKTQLFCAR